MKTKYGPWRYIGDNWFMRETKNRRRGQQAPAKDVYKDVLARLVSAVAMNCEREALEQAYGKHVADIIEEADEVLEA